MNIKTEKFHCLCDQNGSSSIGNSTAGTQSRLHNGDKSSYHIYDEFFSKCHLNFMAFLNGNRRVRGFYLNSFVRKFKFHGMYLKSKRFVRYVLETNYQIQLCCRLQIYIQIIKLNYIQWINIEIYL